jgi:hypothetical protein
LFVCVGKSGHKSLFWEKNKGVMKKKFAQKRGFLLNLRWINCFEQKLATDFTEKWEEINEK